MTKSGRIGRTFWEVLEILTQTTPNFNRFNRELSISNQKKLKMRLKNKTAVVTGGATGIGEAVAKLFAKEGAKVVVAGLPSDPVTEVVQEINNAAKDNVAVGYQGEIGRAHV